jgi:hypothetical protein
MKKAFVSIVATMGLSLALIRSSVVFGTSLDGAYNISISAENLIEAYKENEVAAAAKYTGVRVTVGGVVQRVGIDQEGDPYVLLAPSPSQAGISEVTSGGRLRCRFPESLSPQVARLRAKSLVAIHGTVVGSKSNGHEIIMKDCSL